MLSKPAIERWLLLMCPAIAIGALTAATNASAWQSPTEHRYLTKPLQLCDEGTFYVGGRPKISPFATSATPQGQRQIIIGQMYVQFMTPMVSKSWPVIMVHGSGYTGSAVEGTAGGNEGWKQYTVRQGVPTYVVDQPGRGRSGFDHTPIHEAVYKIQNGDIAGGLALLPGGGTQPQFGFSHEGTVGWNAWFGHFVPSLGGNFDQDVTMSDMIRHGGAGDPQCVAAPSHCTFLGRLPMEPEAPWAVDQAIKSRMGNGAPAGIGTVTGDNAQVMENASYLALDAYKFDLPNAEAFLPFGNCPDCTPSVTDQDDTWSPLALAELIEGIGGAIVATHSQSGIHGHHLVRILRDAGKLDLLKGLITIEGSCSFTASGTAAADYVNIPYLAFIGDYTGHSPVCQASVAAINAAGGNAEYLKLDEAGWWQGGYAGPFGDAYVGPFRGVSHMMMIEDNPAPDGRATNLQVMDVMLEWAANNIASPGTQACGAKGVPPGLSKKPGGLPPGQAKKL
jgi:hypothetical protein